MLLKKYPYYQQLDAMDCGPTCLRMVAKYYGKSYSLPYLRDKSFIGREGVSLLGISDAAENIGFRTLAAKIPFEKLAEEITFPCIAHWMQSHFVVVYNINKNTVTVADPAKGIIKFTKQEFLRGWQSGNNEEGIVLLLEPTPTFFTKSYEEKSDKTGFKFLFSYLFAYKKYLTQLFIGLAVGSILQLIFPFLTQSLVDYGINNRDIGFVYTILLAQTMLFVSRTSVELIRSWILLHIGTRINISIISDFLIKLMKLPISFFNTKMIGDILQRIGDHQRISAFLTGSSLSILFSAVNFVVFGIVLLIYSRLIFLVFLLGSVLYVAWVLFFMKQRRDIDNKRFIELSNNQSNLIQLIAGMPEIKLNNCEKQKRWEWERIQAMLFRLSIKSLSLNQYQQTGASFINEFKNIIISFIAAQQVIEGNLTLGMMLAITYIIGQLDGPLMQFISFLQAAQDAKISLERMGEIHNQKEEEESDEERISIIPEDQGLKLENVSFQYDGPHSEKVLKNISIEIPHGKITAIVGMSGSGKTTLLKLLLKFFDPVEGEIRLGDVRLNAVSNRIWRQKCGVVMQEGYIFSDSIANNIAISDEKVSKSKLLQSVKVANIQDVIESLPLGYNTKIGQDGVGLSQGQKQRILIARAAYKNPEFIFFDEATNALDANNEKIIMENLEQFFKGRTVVVVAHRLSTVKNADQILVMEKGEVIERGTHKTLTAQKGTYFNLVKNQLEMDK